MPTVLTFVCYLLATIAFFIAAFMSDRFSGRMNLVAAGLFFSTLPHLWASAEAIG